ncbi:MAG: hypothetical protein IJV16_03720 [Lachnospiraceae bacterium]|nr:hypothetical protein [Lachnospiraceae bacterium]
MSPDQKKLSISVMGAEHGILIGRKIVEALGLPDYICILKGEDKQSIAIAPCSRKHVLSFKVPDNYMQRRNSKLRIYSHAFVEELLMANDLEPDKTHRIMGEYSKEHNAAIFPLKVL